MVPNSRPQLALWLCGGVGLLLAACQAAPTAAPAATPVVAASATQAATSISIPSTATPLPTDKAAPPGSPTAAVSSTAAATVTASLTSTPSPTAAPTDTPGSPTAAPTGTAKPTAAGRLTGAPTRPPVTITPLGPPSTGSIYSSISGPAGYSSSIQCQRAGAACAPVMPAGDISFHLVLASDAAAPWTHFVNYGLSVEKDGANVAGLFMFVDAGWLQPGTVVGFGASRHFNQSGAYVIRSSGCMTTDTKSNGCGWATLAGDVVTFVIE